MKLLLILIHILVIGAVSWQFSKYFRRSKIYPYFWAGFLWKLLNGVAFGLFYSQLNAGGDTWQYFADAKILAQWSQTNVLAYIQSFFWGLTPDISQMLHFNGQPRAVYMAQLVSPLALISGSNYWVMGGYLSLLSFMGLWMVTNNLASTYKSSRKAAVWAFLFMPSTVFWSSGLSKEALFMAGWGCMVSLVWPHFSNSRSLKIWQIIPLLLLSLILIKLKYYYMAVTLPVLMAALTANLIWPKGSDMGYRWLALFLLIVPAFTLINPNLNFQNIAAAIKENASQITLISSPKALINYLDHQNPVIWCLINTPMALISGLIRPFWLDLGNIWQNLVVLENTVVLLLGIGSYRHWRGISWSGNWWFPVTIYVFLLATLLALSTPNMGTLVRYKVVFFPILVFLLLAKNSWWDKITVRLP